MKLSEVRRLIDAEVLVGEEWLDQIDAHAACGADLMSDVLAFTKSKTLLLTGLTNCQVIRTAELIDLIGLVFVRGKRPGEEVLALARENRLPVLLTTLPLYESCGVLYSAGLGGTRQT